MFVSHAALSFALTHLAYIHPFFGMSFLGFKKANLPVGHTMTFPYRRIREEILEIYFRPDKSYAGFYNPFITSNKSNRWTAARYDQTSLQRFTKDTFGDAFIHDQNSSAWGWKLNYVSILRGLLTQKSRGRKINAFSLGAWLFRLEDLGEIPSKQAICERVFSVFNITTAEREALFDESVPRGEMFSAKSLSSRDIFSLIGLPPAYEMTAVESLVLEGVGPAEILGFQPKPRLNIITGDNSLGKTFILECLWWALTGRWVDYPARPTRLKGGARIKFSLRSDDGTRVDLIGEYDRVGNRWSRPRGERAFAGLGIYARYDGSFVIWDPLRQNLQAGSNTSDNMLVLRRENVQNGLELGDGFGLSNHVTNGLIRDFVTWQSRSEFEIQWNSLEAALDALSPTHLERLRMGQPTRLPGDSREIPCLVFPYGEVPFVFASAGIQRVVSLAYMIVWTWYEHLQNASGTGTKPNRRVVLLIDEAEAHLHPRWQRSIVPSVLRVLTTLLGEVTVQVCLATHSPLVLASAEPDFEDERDGLFHLNLSNGEVLFNEQPFVRHGSVDAWLVSEIFGLSQARSLDAESAIERAKDLQLQKSPNPKEVLQVDADLRASLPDDDPFWVRWVYFARQFER